MKIRLKIRLCLFAVALGATVGARGAADEIRLGDNVLAAGETIALEAAGMKSVFALGESVVQRASVSGDAHLAGDRVETGKIGGDAYLAGRAIIINNVVGGQLWAAGENVTLAAVVDVGDDAFIAANRAVIDGKIGGGLWINAETVLFGGLVVGDLKVSARNLTISDGARVIGDLHITSPTRPAIPDGAVDGEIRYQAWDAEELEGRGGLDFLMFFSALVAGAFLLGFGGDFARRAARVTAEKPWPTLARGFAVFAAALLAPPMLFFTVVAAPLGIIALLLIAPLFFFGYVLGAWIFGGALWRRWKGAPPDTFSRRLLALAAALILVSLLLWIPPLGVVVIFALLFFGLGGGLRALTAQE